MKKEENNKPQLLKNIERFKKNTLRKTETPSNNGEPMLANYYKQGAQKIK